MPDHSTVERAADPSRAEDNEISLLDLLVVLAKHKRLVLSVPLVTAIGAVIVSLLMPNIYTGTARILPPQQSASAASALLNQLGGALGNLAGSSGLAGGLRTPNDLYVGMLRSRTVADSLIERFGLGKIYGHELQSSLRNTLQTSTSKI